MRTEKPPRALVIAAFAAVYLIWGSTYLAIRFSVETLPPLLSSGARWLIAGGLLYAWVRLRGTPAPSLKQWLPTAIVGALVLVGGNGGVVWAEQFVPSGLAALLVATVPLWMALLQWAGRGGARPTGRLALGLIMGFGGVGLLVSPADLVGGGRVEPLGAAVLLFASFSWALGSLYSRNARLPRAPLLATAMQMLSGGFFQALIGLGMGELSRFDPSSVAPRSVVALGYLIVFGSLVGFSAYIWLLRVSTPALVSTYAYVNPVIAVLLGWALAGEPLTLRVIVAAGIILAAVMLIGSHRAPKTASGAPTDTDTERVRSEELPVQP